MRPSDEMNEPAQRSAAGSFNPLCEKNSEIPLLGYYDKGEFDGMPPGAGRGASVSLTQDPTEATERRYWTWPTPRRKTMRKKKVGGIEIKNLALLVVFAMACRAMAQDAGTMYTKMAPVDQYLMADRDAEIALARSAAPESIARDAEVQVLARHGFETAVKGKNGFVCIVGRGWTSAADPDFWNPKVRVPMCVNAPAARSYLLRFTKETEWGLAGRTQAQMAESITAAIARRELPAMESGAMCYMMSKQGYGGDSAPHWPSHLMFFYSDIDPAIWGANLPGSPIVGMSDPVEHLTQFVVAVQRWSDGTEGR